MMEGRDVRVWFPIRKGLLRRTVGHIKAVDGIEVAVRERETVGVVGESGSGKTTLGLALLRLERSRGEVRYRERDIQGLSWSATPPTIRCSKSAASSGRGASRAWPGPTPRTS